MQKWLGGIILSLAGAAWAGENIPLETLVQETLATLDRITGVLSTIRDEDSAKAAKPELKKVAAEFLALRKKAAQAEPPTKEQKDQLAKKYKAKLEESVKKLLAQVTRVQGVAGGKDALTEIREVLVQQKKAKDKNPQKE